MSFLKFLPAVYIIGEEYEICVALEEFGLVTVKVGEEVYYEENSGVLPTEKLYARIRIPAKTLDREKAYTISFRKTLERKNYWSTLGEEQTEAFKFKPIKSRGEINIYHIADVHQHYESAKKNASFFGENTDLYIFNGDIGEVQSVEDFMEVAKFVGEVAKGEIPVIFVRGNHDTRGYLPEKYTDYFPANGKDTFFEAKAGPLSVICLDLGEDKPDEHSVYGGFNNFYAFRRRETAFLRKLCNEGKRFDMAVCHIAPQHTAEKPDSEFNIEGELYEEWNSLLSKMGVRVMLTGHMHKAFVLEKNDKRSLRENSFPIIVGSMTDDDYRIGAALSFSGDSLSVKFTDAEHKIKEEYAINLPSGSVIKF